MLAISYGMQLIVRTIDWLAELFGSNTPVASTDVEMATAAPSGGYSAVFKDFAAIKAQITLIEYV